MKSFKEEMENQAEIEDFNPEDILNAFRQLVQPVVSPNKKVQEQNCSEVIAMKSVIDEASIKQSSKERSNLPKKTCIIKKYSQIKQRELQARQYCERSLGRLSNFSRESDLTQRNINQEMIEDSLQRNQSDSVASQELVNLEIMEELRELDEEYKMRQEQFEVQRQKEKTVLRNLLQQSFRKKIEYENYLKFIGKIKGKLVDGEMTSKEVIQFLQSQESSLRGKKGKKNASNSEQEDKLSDVLMRQRKSYVSGLLVKLSKERERYGSIELGQNKMRLSELSQNRAQQLKRCSQLQQLQILCSIERSSEHIQQILCMDMQKITQVIISCYTFNLTVPKQRRFELYQEIKEVYNQSRRFTASSSSIFFSNKASLFVPVSNIYYREQQILVLSEKEQNNMVLGKFLSFLEFNGGEQGMFVLRMLVRACLRIVEQISNQASRISAVLLPSSIFVNSKFDFRFRNVIFNEILYRNFRHLLSQEDFYFFPPEEKPDPSSVALWSLGVLVFFLYFGSKPFQKYSPYSWSSRQYFLVVNELQIPNKSPASEKAREFIYGCLSKKVSSTVLLELSSESFMIVPGK